MDPRPLSSSFLLQMLLPLYSLYIATSLSLCLLCSFFLSCFFPCPPLPSQRPCAISNAVAPAIARLSPFPACPWPQRSLLLLVVLSLLFISFISLSALLQNAVFPRSPPLCNHSLISSFFRPLPPPATDRAFPCLYSRYRHREHPPQHLYWYQCPCTRTGHGE